MEKAAFSNDLFDRKRLAERLLYNFASNEKSAVVLVDAPWGDGKTYFGKNFSELLRSEHGSFPIYIDAFESDFVDDPFIMLSSNLHEQSKEILDSANASDFLKKSALIAKKLIPTIAKTAVSCATLGVLDKKMQDEVRDSLADGMASIASEIATEMIKDFSNQKQAVLEFKNKLTELAAAHRKKTCTDKFKNGLPLFVFIDELDRCMPTFSVRLLERVKHFFDVDNIVFILLANKEQLVGYLKGVYGKDVDGEMYIEKFINISISLTSLPPNQQQLNSYEYAQKSQFSVIENQDPRREKFNNSSLQFITTYCKYNNLPLRVIDKFYSYINIIDNRADQFGWYICTLIVLKLMKPLLYDKFLLRDKDSIKEAVVFLTEKMTDSENLKSFIIESINLFTAENDNFDANNSTHNFIRGCCRGENISTKDAYHRAAQYLDFKIYG